MILNTTISNLILLRSISSIPTFGCSKLSLLVLKQSKFEYFYSSLIRSIPASIKVNSCSFSHFLQSPIQIKKDENDLISNSSLYSLSKQSITDKTIQIISIPTVSISDSTFINNTGLHGQPIEESTGGAIFILGAVQVYIARCSFQYCISINAGAANLCNCKSNITQCLFTRCKSFDNVGALWSMGFNKIDSDCNLSITETNFSRNSAGKNCGALNVNMTNSQVFSCIFDNNFADCSVGAAAFIGEFATFLSFIDFINNNCKDDCAALWLQGNLEYMNNIHKISLDTIHFTNNTNINITDQIGNEMESNNSKEIIKDAIHTFGIVSLYFKSEICFDGKYEHFLVNHNDDQFTIQQNFKGVLFKNNSQCPFHLNAPTPVICPQYTNPYVENMLIKGKIPLFMPIQI